MLPFIGLAMWKKGPDVATIEQVLELLIPRDAVRLVVPGLPPSVNSHHVRTRKGGLCLSKAALRFRWDVRLLSGDAIHRFEKTSAFGVYILYYLSNTRRLDADNGVKEVLDALKHVVIPADDSQIKLVISRCMNNSDTAKTEIVVWALPLIV